MIQKAFQDHYPDHLSNCYGCGRLNAQGWHLKSCWDGEETVARFKPQDYHIAMEGFVYGGLIASIIDCHGIATAVATLYRDEPGGLDSQPTMYVTASLHIEYIQPVTIGHVLEVRGKVKEIKQRHIIVSLTVSVLGEICAVGEVVAAPLPREKQWQRLEQKCESSVRRQ
jgi:acyl-coenzyme A thioesterase PaaI-like protein